MVKRQKFQKKRTSGAVAHTMYWPRNTDHQMTFGLKFLNLPLANNATGHIPWLCILFCWRRNLLTLPSQNDQFWVKMASYVTFDLNFRTPVYTLCVHCQVSDNIGQLIQELVVIIQLYLHAKKHFYH